MNLQDLMRNRLATEQPDLDTLVPAVLRRGRRARTVRRLGTGVAALAVVGGVAGGVATLASGHSGGTTAIAPASGTTSTPSASATPSTPPTNADGVYVGDKARAPGGGLAVGKLDGDGDIVLEVQQAPDNTLDYLVSHYPHTPLRFIDLHQKGTAPLSETAAGWTCQWTVEDQKGLCTKPGAIASVNWRPADEYSGFADDAGHADTGPGYAQTGVTEMHGGLFATVQPMTDAKTTTQADIDQLTAGISWK